MQIGDDYVTNLEAKSGEICVGWDPQERLGFPTYIVSKRGDGTLLGDTVQLGLFWDREMAVRFAKMCQLS